MAGNKTESKVVCVGKDYQSLIKAVQLSQSGFPIHDKQQAKMILLTKETDKVSMVSTPSSQSLCVIIRVCLVLCLSVLCCSLSLSLSLTLTHTHTDTHTHTHTHTSSGVERTVAHKTRTGETQRVVPSGKVWDLSFSWCLRISPCLSFCLARCLARPAAGWLA